jgi:molecular chaperone IbpA
MSNDKLTTFQPYHRFGVGFDRMFNELDRLLQVNNHANGGGYPPFNLEKTSDTGYRITLAVAGFTEKDIELTQQENTLIVSGEKQPEETTANYLHRGIATRSFKREFVLGDRVEVNTASLKDGMLVIDLTEIIPEENKPKRIPLIKE